MLECCYVCNFRTISSEPHNRWHLFRTNCFMGQQRQKKNTCAAVTSVCFSSYTSGLLYKVRSWTLLIFRYLSHKHSMAIVDNIHKLYHSNFRVVGTQNAHNLISVSTDGRLCSWSLDMLSAPQETLELQVKNSTNVKNCGLFPIYYVYYCCS